MRRVLKATALICRVSTSFGRDHLSAAAQRVEFCVRRRPGVDLGTALRSSARRFARAVDFFALFFTAEIITEICDMTNKYAWMHILEKQSYSERDGSWKQVTPDEMKKFIGLLIYMGIVQVPRLHCYWNTRKLFSGLLPPSVMPRNRFKALLAFLSVSDPEKTTAASHGKLHRVASLLKHINASSAQFFQPDRSLSVDERMVKSKGRSGIRQYMRDKVIKWGYKLWVLADSKSGYTVQFNVYTGKREAPSARGLAFDVVTRLAEDYLDQGYIIYLDNFYTSTSLFVHLLERKTLACGTTRKDRRGFPAELKDTQWEKKAKRGDVRWLRDQDVLYLQWKDKRVVHMMSTAHTANKFVLAKRRRKVNNKWEEVSVKKPMLIDKYNVGMLGVDKSDQLIGTYNVLMKCVRWWKTLFFHSIDIAVVNSFILFDEHRRQHPEVPELSRGPRFDQFAFRLELVEQLIGLDEQQHPDPKAPPAVPASCGPKDQQHKPQKLQRYRNCKLCYQERKVEQKTNVFCETCSANLCFTASRNCFARWHDSH
ncbi:piggyBac transposable element-derived protein 4-like [Dermacentor andersoni]|uniref:piggyBac transposable element-derived protein 4-like n=1 Tax=Dermacentor andersoni TaxID=34620 RepID=UPI003B3ADD03